MPALHLLTGPTAVGKTEWALQWAERHGAEIVSCDSLLFYRGMDIGTAKPTPDELRRVPHHLIDICDVAEPMDIAGYVGRARAAVEDIVRRGRAVLVTGGSGFYLKSFLAPVADNVDVPEPIRAEVAALGHEDALKRLRELNPRGLGTLDAANPRRVARALERCLASGLTIEELVANFARMPGPFADFAVIVTVLDRQPDDLLRRIEQRVQSMLAAGLVEEVRRLQQQGIESNPSAARAIGYREVLALFAGELSEATLAAEIVKNTRALVKKQRTWFRTQLPPHRTLRADQIADATALFGS
jgi:tRNA dimethylallyltransferase